jgi:hypothetical protein
MHFLRACTSSALVNNHLKSIRSYEEVINLIFVVIVSIDTFCTEFGGEGEAD